MIAQIFNSSVVAGPEKLIIPNLAGRASDFELFFLRELRRELVGVPPWEFASSNGLRTHVIDVKSRRDEQAIVSLGMKLKERSIDIAHAHDVKASLCLRDSGFNGPIISTHHGVRGRPDIKTKFFESYYVNLVLPCFDRCCAVSSTDFSILAARGLSASKLRLHLNGLTATTSELSSPKELLGPKPALRLVWIGRFSPEKAPLKALAIIEELRRLTTDKMQLVFVGDGELRTKAEQFADSKGLQESTLFVGYQKNVLNFIAESDLLLNTSAFEGLPITALESAAMGKPICAKAADGFLDLFPEGKRSLLYMPSDSPAEIAHRIWSQRECLSGIGEALQTAVSEHFSSEAWLGRLDEIYSELR